MQRIRTQDLRFDPASYTDPNGRVFHWEGKILRGIVGAQEAHVRRLVTNPIIMRLQQRGLLVETTVTDAVSDDFPLILEHRSIPFVSYCFEWTPYMLKEAALLTLRICEEVSDDDLTMQDAYPWNIVFDGSKPVHVDFGSFVPARNEVLWAPYEQFCHFFLYPLYLYSAGYYDVARRFLFDYLGGLSDAQFFSLAPTRLKVRYPWRYAKRVVSFRASAFIGRHQLHDRFNRIASRAYRNIDTKRARQRFFRSLIREVEQIVLPIPKTLWHQYYERHCSYGADELAKKAEIVARVLDRHHPSSVFDAGANTGQFSVLAAAHGSTVIAVDTDEPSVSALFTTANAVGQRITPLVVDVLNPSPAFGWCGQQFPSAMERLRTDMVFAFALIHHLAIAQRQQFGRALDALDAFTNRYLLLEFVAPEDPMTKLLLRQSLFTYPWYRMDVLERELERRYTYEKFPPHAAGRQLILCEKRRT